MVQGVSSVSKWYKGYLESANGTRSVLSQQGVQGYLESAKATGGTLSQQRLQGYLESARGIGVF